MWESFATGLLLSILAFWLMWRNRLDRRERAELPAELLAHDYFVQLDGRRKQINVTLLIIGVALVCGPLVSGTLMQVIYWVVVMILVCFMGMLALVDLQSSRNFLDELRAEESATCERLETESERLRQDTAKVDPEANGDGLSQKKNGNCDT